MSNKTQVITNTALNYVHLILSAENAIRELNNRTVHGKVLRVMMWEPDFRHKLPENSNVFLKNVPNTYDHEKLHQVFVQFGPILSCKVSLNL